MHDNAVVFIRDTVKEYNNGKDHRWSTSSDVPHQLTEQTVNAADVLIMLDERREFNVKNGNIHVEIGYSQSTGTAGAGARDPGRRSTDFGTNRCDQPHYGILGY